VHPAGTDPASNLKEVGQAAPCGSAFAFIRLQSSSVILPARDRNRVCKAIACSLYRDFLGCLIDQIRHAGPRLAAGLR